jgi:hypothetical protein
MGKHFAAVCRYCWNGRPKVKSNRKQGKHSMTQSSKRLSFRLSVLGLMIGLVAVTGLVFARPSGVKAETASADALANDKDEMLIFDWNKPVTKSDSGFAMEQPPMANGNWVSPVNFAEGTIYFRAHIQSIPKNQPSMKLGWCVWQNGFQRENCKGNRVAGVPGNIVTWSVKVKDMWKKNGVAIDWSRPRTRNGFVVRNNRGPVSAKAGFNWSGENPADWYPLDLRYTAVVVAKGGTFSGWDHYIH